MKELNIAIVGATGNLGREILSLLEEEASFKVASLKLFASGANADDESSLSFKESDQYVTPLTEADFKAVDVAFFAVPKSVTEEYAVKAKAAGAKIIDASDALSSAPLMIKGVTDVAFKGTENEVRIANPLTSQLATLLKPLQAKAKLQTIISSTYQSTSGSGRQGMDELFRQATTMLGGAGAEAVPAEIHPVQIAFNAIPLVGSADGDATTEETRVSKEVKQVLGDDIQVSVTAVRIPTFVGYAQSVTLFTDTKVDAAEASRMFTSLAGVYVIDNIAEGEVSTPFGAAETEYTFVSRIRNNADGSLSFWVVSDNLRAGSACQMVNLAAIMA